MPGGPSDTLPGIGSIGPFMDRPTPKITEHRKISQTEIGGPKGVSSSGPTLEFNSRFQIPDFKKASGCLNSGILSLEFAIPGLSASMKNPAGGLNRVVEVEVSNRDSELRGVEDGRKGLKAKKKKPIRQGRMGSG